MGIIDKKEETRIIRELVSEACANLTIGNIEASSREFAHPIFGKLLFKIVFDKREEEEHKGEYVLNFIVAKSLDTFCSTWLSAGKEQEILQYLNSLKKNTNVIVDELPSYYRLLFEED